MASMEFTMLSTEFRRDPRWRSLEQKPMVRLTYLSLMVNSLVTYTGHFHSPLEIFSYESMIPKHELVLAFRCLEQVGLVEFDADTEYVRIIGWFSQRRAPKNLNCLKSSLKHYWQPHVPNDIMTARSLAELSVAALIKSRDFKTETENSMAHKANYTGLLSKFVEDSLVRNPNLAFALKMEFEVAGIQHQAYFQDFAEMVPGLEKCAALFDGDTEILDGSATVSEPLRDGLSTLSKRLPNGSEIIGVPFPNSSGRRRT